MSRQLGSFQVSAVGYGAMSLSMPEAVENPHLTVHAALEAGVTLIDTADIYAPSWDAMGHNERVISDALRSYPGDTGGVVVATKAGITRNEGESWGRNATLAYLRSRAEASIAALGVERLDLLYLHRPDRRVAFEENMVALGQLKADGLAKEVGISNANLEEIAIAVEVLGEGGLAAVQNEFSPWFNHTSKPELDYCGAHGIAFVPFAPLGGAHRRAVRLGQRFPAIGEVSEELGISPYRVTLAWELSLGEHVIPIPGATRPETIRDSAAAMNDVVPTELLEKITKGVL
ncbi:aldo/keto reductase [Tessaracoccus sp. OH4464_COT-324]|uniref:aldo/keto reductase n=1 Tax=Tessaracoccus sp. OH4464_COT-324 TaxID=2491059 RepID=UPI000F635598|nr:aldo/keto reductase [Tessaracoccus sp. OH4464_COT-324]RRD48017.1 aldo/keto reductase [Tessaracoccus sp. OH4464_COT-324]